MQTKATIVQGDAIKFLLSQPQGSIDLVFGSPPYCEARTYTESGMDIGIAMETHDWVNWMRRVWHAAQWACKGLVAFVVAGNTNKYRWSAAPALLMAELATEGFCLRNPPIFHRHGIMGSGGPDWLRSDYEWIICTTRPGRLQWSDNVACGAPPKYRPGGAPSHRTKKGQRVSGRSYRPPAKANPGNVLHFPVGKGHMGNDLAHENEAPMPLGLAEFFVKSYCPPGGMVADCFCGSGTTGEAALKHGRNFIGCDTRQSQVDLAGRRVGATSSHPACPLASSPQDGPRSSAERSEQSQSPASADDQTPLPA